MDFFRIDKSNFIFLTKLNFLMVAKIEFHGKKLYLRKITYFKDER